MHSGGVLVRLDVSLETAELSDCCWSIDEYEVIGPTAACGSSDGTCDWHSPATPVPWSLWLAALLAELEPVSNKPEP